MHQIIDVIISYVETLRRLGNNLKIKKIRNLMNENA